MGRLLLLGLEALGLPVLAARLAFEERGLLGSQDIAAEYQARRVPVVAALQMDMTSVPGNTPVLNLITDYVNRDLTRYVEKLVDTYVRVKWGESSCGYACSDHASWTKAGYPSAFPFESPTDAENDNIHSVRDTADTLNFTFGLHFAKIVVAFAVELGL
jgi:leucyl aminopeptidase